MNVNLRVISLGIADLIDLVIHNVLMQSMSKELHFSDLIH